MMAKANKAMSELNKQEQAAIAAGGAVVSYFLGCNEALEALFVLMVIDYLNLFYDSDYANRSEPVVVEANNWGADILVSLHCNASCSKDALALALHFQRTLAETQPHA